MIVKRKKKKKREEKLPDFILFLKTKNNLNYLCKLKLRKTRISSKQATTTTTYNQKITIIIN